jgi:hypothetical protein
VPLLNANNRFAGDFTWLGPAFGTPIADVGGLGFEDAFRVTLARSSGNAKILRAGTFSARLDTSGVLNGSLGGGSGPSYQNRLVAVEADSWVDDAATVPWIVGVIAKAGNHNSTGNTVDNLAAIWADADVPRLTNNAYGIRVTASNGTAATNGYALRIDGVPSTTNPFGIYVNGPWPNYFGGPVTVAGALKAGTTSTTLTDAAGGILPAALNAGIDPAKLTPDSTHRFATDAEKTTWNGKQDALGFTAVPNTRTVAGHALSADVTVSKSDVGLSNADNTSDANKPVSAAQQAALDLKAILGANTFTGKQTHGAGAAIIASNNSLSDNGSTIATDASLGNNFRVAALTANVTLSNPTNPTDGQVVTWEVIQHASAAKTLSFGAAFGFGAEITACTISTALSSHNFITAIYNSTAAKWYVRGCITGY